jgi:hypothetical protein
MRLRLGQRLFDRRTALRVVGGAALATAASWRTGHAAGPYQGALIDAHAHLSGETGLTIDWLIGLFDAAGIQGALLFGLPWPQATDARDRFPRRIVPFLAEGYATAVHPDSSYVNPAGLEQLLAGGFVRGLGEIICRHSPFQLGASGGGASAPANNTPADHPGLVEAYRLAGRYRAPVTIHQEWFFAEELERAVQAAQGTTFVWAHAGHGPPSVVGPMMERNANLLADLSARTPWIGPGTVLLRPDGSMAPEWSSLLHAYPDRFLIGLDLFAPAHYQPAYVTQMADYYRGLLGQLDPAAAELIGHGNAERIAPVR